MSTEPMPVELAIADATVITMDASATVLHGATVGIDDGTIVHVGVDRDRLAAARTIDAGGGILLPGLVNAHAHLAMTMFRGLADDVDLDGFLGRILPAEGAVLSADTVAAGTSLAVAECLRAGVTTVLDMYFWPEVACEVAGSAGLHLHAGPVFVELAGPDRRPFPTRLAWAAERLAEAAAAGEPTWVCPHSAYLLDEQQLTQIGALASEHRAGVHTHACETLAELQQVEARHGRTPIEVFADTGLLGRRTVLAHGVHLTDRDIEAIARSGAAVGHCPASNQKLASGFARIPDLLAAGVPISLGTDGAASANDLDLWLAMRLAAYSQAALRGVGAVTALDVLRMATIDGARALGIDDAIGSVEVGKRADLVVLDPYSPALTPAYDPISTAAYAAGRGDVRWVIADGRVVVDDRELTTIDVDDAIGRVQELRPAIEGALR